MSLIKCPECGKEKVSDTAESCPECGFGIKLYYTQLKKYENQYNFDNDNHQISQHIDMPTKPIFSVNMMVYCIIMTIVLVVIYRYPSIINDVIILPSGTAIFLLILFVILPISIYVYEYIIKYKNYTMANDDFELYKKKKIESMIESEYSSNLYNSEKVKVECKYCHSINTTKITNSSKAVNIFLFGIFGQKRKYQWHCNDCGSNF